MSYLPGMFPGILNSMEFNLTFVGSTSNHLDSIDISTISPGAIQAGDLCLIFQYVTNGAPVDGTPSGFTELIADSSGDSEIRAKISAKLLNGTETTVTGYLSATQYATMVLVFRPSRTIINFVLGDSNSQITDSDPAAQTINSGGSPGIPTLAFGMMSTAGAAALDPRTISPAMDEVELTGALFLYGHYKIYNIGDTPANHSYDMDDEGGSNAILSGYLRFN